MSKNDKYIPWLVVGVAGLILASLGRSIVLKSGGDNSSANLVFIIVLVGVVLAYLALIAFVTSIPELLQKLKKKDSKEKLITNAEAPEQEIEEIISEANEIEPDIIKNEEIEETIQPTIPIVDDTPIIATEPTKPKVMSQLRKEV